MSRLRWFEGYGIEIEYMLVDTDTLTVAPIADRLLAAAAGGEVRDEVERGAIAWTNELALHLIELKTNGPASTLEGLDGAFQEEVDTINGMLKGDNVRLLPGAMHPWMNPDAELKLWPHGNNDIYEAYDRIFSCRGHGWSNLQSMQINLPFGDDEEFGRLHRAIRLVLPIIPALAASSPFIDGKATGLLDTRMEVYRHNARRIPSITGAVIPEPLFTEESYRSAILQTMYDDIAALDPDNVLRDEWLNSRGAIARFDRHAIEIRVIDSQECPRADLAIAALISALTRALGEERWSDAPDQRSFATNRLADTLSHCNRDAESAVIEDAGYLRTLGYDRASNCRAGDLWTDVTERLTGHVSLGFEIERTLERILTNGTLARRLLNATGPQPDREKLTTVYRRVADCLADGKLFLAE